MNWIDARKQQILDEHEKRKAYENIEYRALKTQEDYQKAYNTKYNEFLKLYDQAKNISYQADDLNDDAQEIEDEAKKKGFKIKTNSKDLNVDFLWR